MRTSARAGIEVHITALTSCFKKLSYYVASRGWGFVLTWAHRVAGLLLVLYMFFHIATLSGLHDPARFASKMDFVDNFFFSFLEWSLAIPVIFHGLNGFRLILYEIFRVRDDRLLIRWVLVLSGIYAVMLGLFMAMGNQHVSAGFFWVAVMIAGVLMAVIVFKRLSSTKHSVLWKLQRLSGAFLLPMAAGHMFFMHLNYRVGHDVDTILARVSNMGIRTLDFVFVAAVFFHAGFGVNTIIGDHVEDRRLRTGLSLLSNFVLAAFALAGIKLICTI